MKFENHFDEIIKLEKSILDPTVRSSREKLDKLITDDFLEFASSGTVYDKEQIIVALTSEKNPLQIDALNFECFDIAKDTVLLTYLTKRSNEAVVRETLRSSIWVRKDGLWRLRYHQGTIKL